MDKEPKNAMEEPGCEGCTYRLDPSGKGWCYFWGKKIRDKFPCWRFEPNIPDSDNTRWSE